MKSAPITGGQAASAKGLVRVIGLPAEAHADGDGEVADVGVDAVEVEVGQDVADRHVQLQVFAADEQATEHLAAEGDVVVTAECAEVEAGPRQAATDADVGREVVVGRDLQVAVDEEVADGRVAAGVEVEKACAALELGGERKAALAVVEDQARAEEKARPSSVSASNPPSSRSWSTKANCALK